MSSDLISHLMVVSDPRSEGNKLYPLEELLLLCICAVVNGAEAWQAIAEFGVAKLAWLHARAFQECFLAWTRAVAQLTHGEVVAIDGKTLRGS